MEKEKMTYRVTSCNKRERRITISVIEKCKTIIKYRTTQLSPAEFEYLSSDATENDIKNFLKIGSYVKIKYNV